MRNLVALYNQRGDHIEALEAALRLARTSVAQLEEGCSGEDVTGDYRMDTLFVIDAALGETEEVRQ